MPRKTQIRKSKKSKGKTRTKKSFRKSRKYRGGCENGSCSSCSNSPLWTSKGGSDLISKDIYNHATDQTFYSSAN